VGSDPSEYPETASARLNVRKFPFREVAPTMSQNAVVSCNRRLLASAIAGTRLNIHLRSEDFVRIVLRGELGIELEAALFPGDRAEIIDTAGVVEQQLPAPSHRMGADLNFLVGTIRAFSRDQLKLQFPSLVDHVGSEAVRSLLLYKLESDLLVNVAGGGE